MDGQIIRELRRARNNKLVDLRQLAQALGGEVVGGQVLCPGPGHSARDRSLAVRPSAQSRFGFIAYSHAGNDWPTIRDYVLEKLDRLSCEPADALRRYQRPPQDHYGLKHHERRQHEKAAWLWSRRRPITGTPAENYLRAARGYSGPIPRTLAFLPPAKPEHYPAMIAAFAACDEPEPGVVGEPLNVNSVHLTLLKPDGSGKADTDPNKLILGRPLIRAIAVAPPNDLLGLAITEGIEDALTAHEATGLGAWAAGAAGFMPVLAAAVPSYIEAVTVYAHEDKAGQAGAHELAEASPKHLPTDRKMATCSTAMLVSTLRRIEMGEMARRVILTTAAAITAAVTSGARIAGTGRPTVPLTKSGYIPTVRRRGGTAAASRRAGDERR